MSGWFTSFFNCRQCKDGELVEDQLVVSDDTGLILERAGYIGGDAVDLEGMIVAPGFLELQTNGTQDFGSITQFQDERTYSRKIDALAKNLPSQGVTGFYTTIPSLPSQTFHSILPSLKPREIPSAASLLGAHVNIPPAHFDAQLDVRTADIVKLITLAPDLPHAPSLISEAVQAGIKVSLGNSTATFDQGLIALRAGATGLTQVVSGTGPLHARQPGLAGLVTAHIPVEKNEEASEGIVHPSENPYFSLVADARYLHASVATLMFRANPRKCMLVTSGAGELDLESSSHLLSDARILGDQLEVEAGKGTTTVPEGVRSLMAWSGCGIAEAVRCVTENVANFMGDGTRGKLEPGRRADLAVLDDEGNVLETWIAGQKVWEKKGWR